MKTIFLACIVVGSCLFVGSLDAQCCRVQLAVKGQNQDVVGIIVGMSEANATPGKVVAVAEGAAKGATCVDYTFLKDARGKVVECKYDCYLIFGGAVCRENICDYVICNDPPGSHCSTPGGPNPGKLLTMAGGGICDPTGEKAELPGMCYYPEIEIDCGSAEACVEVGWGRDFCRVLPPKKDHR